jgi:hypothetical protein
MRLAAALVFAIGLIGVTSAQTQAPAPWHISGNGVTLVANEGTAVGKPGFYDFSGVKMSINGVEISADEASIRSVTGKDTIALRGNVLATLPGGPQYGFVVVQTVPSRTR